MNNHHSDSQLDSKNDVTIAFILQVLSVAVYNHYKRIFHGSLKKGLVIAPTSCCPQFFFRIFVSWNACLHSGSFYALKVYKLHVYQ